LLLLLPGISERLASIQHVAAAIAQQQQLGECLAALEAALRHHSCMRGSDLWKASARSHMFVNALCTELQRIGAFSSSSSSGTGWELPLLSLVTSNLKMSAAGVAQLADHLHQQQQQQTAGPLLVDSFLKHMMGGCGALDLAWGIIAAAHDDPPQCFSDSSWHGSRKLQCMAACTVMRARVLTHAGCLLEAVAAGQVPFTAP
jgi:hypothetical protein